MRLRKTGRRPGRPLLGAEPLGARLTVMVTQSMLEALEARAQGRIPEFVRGALRRALAGGRVGGRGFRGGPRQGRRIHR